MVRIARLVDRTLFSRIEGDEIHPKEARRRLHRALDEILDGADHFYMLPLALDLLLSAFTQLSIVLDQEAQKPPQNRALSGSMGIQ